MQLRDKSMIHNRPPLPLTEDGADFAGAAQYQKGTDLDANMFFLFKRKKKKRISMTPSLLLPRSVVDKFHLFDGGEGNKGNEGGAVTLGGTSELADAPSPPTPVSRR